MKEKIISKETKIISRVVSISLANADSDALSLEVISEFTEKEVSQVLRENNYQYPCGTLIPATVENILRKWEETVLYPMRQVNETELMKLRFNKKVPGVVYKKDNILFYSPIPGNLNLAGKADSLGKHACSEQCTQVCRGCQRTRDLTVAYQQRIGSKHLAFKTAVVKSWRIEKYDFIREGLETFNMVEQNEAFIVLQCENYRVNYNKPQQSNVTIGAMKAGLASFVWEDFSGDRTEMLLRLKARGLINERR